MRQLMTLPKVKAIVMRLRAKSPPLMRQHLQSQSLRNPLRIQLLNLLPLIRQLILRARHLLIRQRVILRVRHLLIRQRVILRVRRLLIHQRMILRARHLLIHQRVILRVRHLLIRQLIHQPRRQRNYVRVINHAPSSALK